MALAARCSLGLGGPARYFVKATDAAGVVNALGFAADKGVPARMLGAGSNVVIADQGYPGLIVEMAQRGVVYDSSGALVRVQAAAGEPWDALVSATVERDLAGLECLSGIPGLVGATPIQNVGAYGQEVAHSIESVEVLDRSTLEVRSWTAEKCGFAYRDSVLKRNPDDHVVLSVTFALCLGGAPAVRYSELQRALASRDAGSLACVRDTVIELRAAKSMVLDPSDDNRRSVGSFFMNPVVDESQADALVEAALAAGLVESPEDVPRHATDDGRSKLAAGWLIERAGIDRGLRRGPVGVSSRHALALVHHGGGSSAQLIELAREVRARVLDRFNIELQPEPVFLGFEEPPL